MNDGEIEFQSHVQIEERCDERKYDEEKELKNQGFWPPGEEDDGPLSQWLERNEPTEEDLDELGERAG